MVVPVDTLLFLTIFFVAVVYAPLLNESPRNRWFEVAEKYIHKIASSKHYVKDVQPTETIIDQNSQSKEIIFSNDVDFHSLLAYGMKDKSNEKTTFRPADKSFGIIKEKLNVEVFGKALQNVLIGLQHYDKWDIQTDVELAFILDNTQTRIAFTLGITKNGNNVVGQISKITTNTFVFDKSTDIKSMLECATLFKFEGKKLIFKTNDDSIKITKFKTEDIKITKADIPEYKIEGKIKLSTVFENLQHYCYFGISHKQRTKFWMVVSGQEMSFTLKESENKHGPFKQINVITDGKMSKYDDFMRIMESKPSKAMAHAIIDTLKTPLNKQSINNFLSQEPKIRDAVLEFILVTHVAEGAVPTDASLETFNKGVKVIQKYEEEIKNNNIPTQELQIITNKKNEKLRELVKKIEKRGRIPINDKVTRNKIRQIAEGNTDFKEEFSVKNWPLRKKGGTQEGRLYMLTDLYNIPVSDEESHLSDTDTAQIIATKKARKEGQHENVASKLKSKINDVVDDQNAACSKQRRKRSICGRSVDEENFKIEDIAVLEKHGKIRVTFTLLEKDNSLKRQSEIILNSDDLVHENFIEYLAERGNSHTGPTRIQKAHKILGLVGILAGISTAKREFEDGNKLRGSIFVSQSIYTISHLSSFDKLASKLSSKIGSKVLSSIAYKFGIEKILQKTASSALVRLAGDIPVIGVAFDVFFIEEDIRDLTNIDLSKPNDRAMLPLEIIHLETDLATTVLSFLGPEMEPLVLALSIFRMTFDYFYIDIYKEMKKVNWQSPWAPVEAFGAFIQGESKGIADIFTGGLISAMGDLRSQVNSNIELLRKLSKSSNYYSIHSTGDSKAIDFLRGSTSFAGGDITFRLGDYGYGYIKIENVPTRNGGTTTVDNYFRIDSQMKDIILGIGESRAFTYSKKTAYLWWIIPIKSYDIICGERLDKSSLHGTYQGNSQNNKFIAVQKIPDLPTHETDNCASKYGQMDSKEMLLQQYHYQLVGNGGKDVFFLGPQISSVQGGEDEDTYIIQPNQGKAYINNYSHKPSTDVLYLSIPFEELSCKRLEDDLWISRKENERVKVENYFRYSLGEHYKHLIFRSADGLIFHPNCVQETVSCFATALEFSDSMHGRNIDLNKSPYEHVISVVGSKASDNIYGNLMNNILDSGGGNDFLQGGGGSDTYLLRNENIKGSNKIIIDNYASDNINDLLIIEVLYVTIKPIRKGKHLQLSCNKRLSVQIRNWFVDDNSGHISFVSGDHILFTVALVDNILKKIPKILDFSSLENGIILDMMNDIITGAIIPTEIFKSVFTVSDTPFDDTISGNSLSNFLTCSGGHDILRGNSGMDKYIMKDGCTELTIDNYDVKESESEDILIIERTHLTGKTISKGKNLIISSRKKRITILRWFVNAKYRHLSFHMKHVLVIELPKLQTDLTLYILELNTDDELDEPNKTIDFEEFKFMKKMKRLYFKSSKRSYEVRGNTLGNYIHLGPSLSGEVQYVEGRNGTDIYDIECGDGHLIVNNFASDLAIDHLKIGLFYSDLDIFEVNFNLTVRSKMMPDHLSVVLMNYCQSPNYQHLQVHTTDGVTLKFIGTCGKIIVEVLKIDMTRSESSRHISLEDNPQTTETKTVYGSLTHGNSIYGNDKPNKLIGGNKNDQVNGNGGNDYIVGDAGDDILNGGGGNDLIFGGDGNDEMYGGKDDDVLYPGKGNDIIDGGEGVDTVVFKGDSINKIGVYVNLENKFGKNADADNDLYISIENAIGTDFDDTLIGSDVDNLLRGYGGEDILIPMAGNDFLFGGEAKDTYLLTSSSGLKSVDNYAKDKVTDVFEIKSASSRNICSFRYNMSLYLTFHHHDKALQNLYVTFNDWYENSLYQHAEFKLTDTTINASDIFQYLQNAKEISKILENLEVTSSFENNMLVISWNLFGDHEFMKEHRDIFLAYRDMNSQEYILVDIQQKANFKLAARTNYEIRLLYVKCGRVIGFTKPHHVFSFVDFGGYMKCYGTHDHKDCITNFHFTPQYIPIRRGWLLEWIA